MDIHQGGKVNSLGCVLTQENESKTGPFFKKLKQAVDKSEILSIIYFIKYFMEVNRMNLYDFTVKTRKGADVALSDFKGKVVLVVNTATGCGFTPQYKELQEIYEADHDKGLEILDFPCNQFADQAPGTDEEIHTFCTGRFGITFPQYAKIDVNGENAIPLYKWLTENTKFEGFGKGPKALMMNGVAKKMDNDFKNNGNIKWNFTKFLIDREGNIVKRFEPTEDMETVKQAVEAAL